MAEATTKMRVVVVTGLSGAGKSTALKALADTGHYCVDNLPPQLVGETVRVCEAGGIARLALGIDVRVGAFLEHAHGAIETLRADADCTVLFLEASDEVLVRRFSETRRPHPMLHVGAPAASGRDADAMPAVLDGVRLERAKLSPIRGLATLALDSSYLTVHELRRQVAEAFGGARPPMVTRVMSFGFKHGVPLDADLVFDVRFLDNPHFVPALRPRTGLDDEVRDFVLGTDGARDYLARVESLLELSWPRYQEDGKSYLTIAIGCTGGRHRSVALTEELARRLKKLLGRTVGIVHRDIERGGMVTLRAARASSPGGPSTAPSASSEGTS